MPEKILSICIPTYNRADILDKTLADLVLEPSFQSGQIEICISDNASPDDTDFIVKKYISKFDNIVYRRNPVNTVIIDGNFPIVASLASGTFIKFLNDYASFIPGELDKIIEIIKENKMEKPVLFFSNNSLLDKTNEYISCNSLESFVKKASYWTTWVLCAGIWRDDFASLNDRDRCIEKFMWCPDIYLRLLSSGRKAIIYNKQFCSYRPLSKKGGYNIYQIFVNNYLDLLKKYKVNKQISYMIFFNEKSKLLMKFLVPWTIILWRNKAQYSFDKRGALSIIFKEYRFHPILYVGLINILLKFLLIWFKNFFYNIKKILT